MFGHPRVSPIKQKSGEEKKTYDIRCKKSKVALKRVFWIKASFTAETYNTNDKPKKKNKPLLFPYFFQKLHTLLSSKLNSLLLFIQ